MNAFSLKTIGLLLLAGVLCGVGCRSLPNSGIDPYGERLFSQSATCPLEEWNNNPNKNCPQLQRLMGGQAPTAPSTIAASPTMTATPVPAAANTGSLPGNLGAVQPGTAGLPYGSTATAMAPGGRGINSAIVMSPESLSNRPAFADTGGYALPTQPISGPAMVMTPREQIAPVGSEVVMISSYLGKGDHLITNEKVEWSLEGVGSIFKIDPGSCCDPLHADFTKAKKISEKYAVTKTSQTYQDLDRGTPDTKDDIHLLRGQTWVSVNSMREGTTYVTSLAPSLKDWSKRSDYGVIHWVDAQWILPTLPISAVGDTRRLTTTVLRQTNGQPRVGWIVRYELLNGPKAGFGPSLAQIEEVPTDMNGQATVMLAQADQQAGTNTIAVRIIRPAGVDGSDRRVTVGNETLRQTWTGNAGIRVKMEGPPNVKPGQDIPYTITVTNNTSQTANGVLTGAIPSQVQFVSANPAPYVSGTLFQWNLSVPPKGASVINLVLRQNAPGTLIIDCPTFQAQASIGQTTGPAATVYTPPTTPIPSVYTPPVAPTPTSNTGPSNVGSIGAAQTYQGAGATTFPVKVKISFVQEPVPHPDQPGVLLAGVKMIVENAGNAEMRNVVLQVRLPQEYKDRSSKGIALIQAPKDAEVINAQCDIRQRPIAVLPVGQRAEFQLGFPSIPPTGYTMIGTVLVNGQIVDTKTETVRGR